MTHKLPMINKYFDFFSINNYWITFFDLMYLQKDTANCSIFDIRLCLSIWLFKEFLEYYLQ